MPAPVGLDSGIGISGPGKSADGVLKEADSEMQICTQGVYCGVLSGSTQMRRNSEGDIGLQYHTTGYSAAGMALELS